MNSQSFYQLFIFEIKTGCQLLQIARQFDRLMARLRIQSVQSISVHSIGRPVSLRVFAPYHRQLDCNAAQVQKRRHMPVSRDHVQRQSGQHVCQRLALHWNVRVNYRIRFVVSLVCRQNAHACNLFCKLLQAQDHCGFFHEFIDCSISSLTPISPKSHKNCGGSGYRREWGPPVTWHWGPKYKRHQVAADKDRRHCEEILSRYPEGTVHHASPCYRGSVAQQPPELAPSTTLTELQQRMSSLMNPVKEAA
ncbi:hypothetical protein PMI40_02233 [Herbaspirillum sp. YR522]|nr:hypothetical protein PMI40_02233 [Herbaspirillum sp. YR522]